MPVAFRTHCPLPAARRARWLVLACLLGVSSGLALAHAGMRDALGAQQRGVSAQAASHAATADVQAVEPAAAVQQPTPAVPDPALPAAAPPPAAMPPRDRGVLFRVTAPALRELPAEAAEMASPPAAPGDTRPSYLLGTIHFGTPEEQGTDYEHLGRLLADTDTFVSEADIDSPWKPEYDGYRWLPVGTPLGGMLDKQGMAMAQALLPAVRPQDLQRMKPWAVLALLEARGESGSDASMDARLQKMAQAGGKRLVHLETLEQQLQALDCVPAAEQAVVLAERLRKSWILRIESAEAMAFYRSRNLDAWLASVDRMDGLGEAAKAIEQRARVCLLEERNARWIGPLETLFRDGPGFVAVGAIHLVGPDGLIARLRRDGFTVEAVPP